MFRFRLEKVLEHRRRLVDRESVRLQEATLTLNQIRVQGDALRGEITELGRHADTLRRAGQPVQFWQLQTGFLAVQAQRLAELRESEQVAAASVKRQREKLIELQRDKEVLGKLAARRRQEWNLAVMRRERKELDEIGTTRAALRRET